MQCRRHEIGTKATRFYFCMGTFPWVKQRKVNEPICPSRTWAIACARRAELEAALACSAIYRLCGRVPRTNANIVKWLSYTGIKFWNSTCCQTAGQIEGLKVHARHHRAVFRTSTLVSNSYFQPHIYGTKLKRSDLTLNSKSGRRSPVGEFCSLPIKPVKLSPPNIHST